MPASRSNTKAPKNTRRDEFSPVDDVEYAIPAAGNMLTEEQVKLRNMIPSLTPAHGPDSTATAILAALSLGSHRPNSHTRRKSEGHVNRPPNAFIVFRRAQVQNMPANVTQHQQRISNLTALFWRVLTTSEQNTWYSLSDDIKKLHNILFPDYNFNPRNPDGSKKSTLPRAGLTSERLEFAWNEAQLLIQKHTVMGQHPPAPPASLTGKVVRPKAPRKGQGTRAKERREQEAAQRAAAAVQATAEASAGTGVYSPEAMSSNVFAHSYFSTVDEESSVASPPSESAIAWRPDFSLEGSVSSRSSPTNSWTELVGPLDAPSESVDPFDNSYTNIKDSGAETSVVVEEYPLGHFGAPFSPYEAHIQAGNPRLFAEMNVNPTSFTPSPMHKQAHHHFTVMPSNEGYYYEEQSGPMNAATILAPSEFSTITGVASGHAEAQYIFHDMDPAATYMDMPNAYTIAHAEYAW